MIKEEYDLSFENDKLKREIEHLENEIRNLKQQNQMITELGEHYKHLYSEVKKQKDDVVEYIKKLSDNTDDTTCYEIDRNSRNDLLRMLGEIE